MVCVCYAAEFYILKLPFLADRVSRADIMHYSTVLLHHWTFRRSLAQAVVRVTCSSDALETPRLLKTSVGFRGH